MNISTAYRRDIDGLRAIAILPVIFFHAFPTLITGGFIGVDVFFVISGFLITSIIAEEIDGGRFNYSSFYSRRVRRLFPTFLVVLASCIAFGWNVLSAMEYKQLAKHILAGLSFVANINLWSEAGYFDVSADSKPLLHLWSLGVEEQFYLVWPTLATLLLPIMNRSTRSVFISLICLIFIAALTSLWSTEAAFYLPLSRFWELFCGAALAVALRRRDGGLTGVPAQFFGAIGLLLIVVPAFLLTSHSPFPFPWALAPVIGASILIATQDSVINRFVLSNRLLVGIGLISYALYLWHWPLLSFLHVMDNGATSAGMRLGALVLAFALSTASYWLLEKPFRSRTKSSLKLWALGTVSVLIGLVAVNIYVRDGLGFRVDSIVSEIIGDKDPHKLAWRSGECFVEREGTDHFLPSCVGTKDRPDLLLWGDSHAAALYPGLSVLAAQNDKSLAQYTAALCKPLIDDTSLSNACLESNKQVFQLISKQRPRAVLLHARWDTSRDPILIKQTIEELRMAGIENLFLVGPSPRWNDDLPKIVFNYYRKNHQIPPQRSSECRFEDAQRDDKVFSELADQLHIRYVTFSGLLFSSLGCLLRTSPDSRDVMMFDADHLTVAGSRFVGPYVWRQIFDLSDN